MHDICTDARSITLFIHNDDDTPVEFVRQFLRSVFGKSEREAIAFTALIENEEKVACGPYPSPVAKALLDSARQSISAAGHGLLITSETACDLCGAPATGNEIPLAGRTACLCNSCLLDVRRASEAVPGDEFKYAWLALDWHFAGIPRNQLVTRARQFPDHMRADVQVAVDKLLASPLHFFGIHEEYRYETLAFCGPDEGWPERTRACAAAIPRRRDR